MDIYLQKNGQQVGPLTEHQIREGIDTGEFHPGDLAWKQGKAAWQPIAALLGLDLSKPPPVLLPSVEKLPAENASSDGSPSKAAPPQFPEATIIVSKSGDGDFATIHSAIVAAVPGATIKIRSGIYEEALTLSKPVTLVGEPEGLVRISHPTFPAIKVSGTQVSLQFLAIGSSLGRRMIEISDSRLELHTCILAPATAVRVPEPDAKLSSEITTGIIHRPPRVQHPPSSKPSNSAQSENRAQSPPPSEQEVEISSHSQLLISDSLVSILSIKVGTGTTLDVRHCRLEVTHISIDGGALCHVSDCKLLQASLDCNGNLALTDTTIREILTSGVRVSNGTATVERCLFEGGENCHAITPEGGEIQTASLLGVKLMSHKHTDRFSGVGIRGSNKARITIKDCKLSSLRRGVEMFNAKDAFLDTQKCRIVGNDGGVSFDVGTPSRLRIEDSEFRDNLSFGLSINSTVCDFRVENTVFSGNVGRGISVLHGGQGTVHNCDFAQNGFDLFASPFWLLRNSRRRNRGECWYLNNGLLARVLQFFLT